MTSKQLVRDTISGRLTPRPVTGPLATHYCAGSAGVSLEEYTMNPRVLADCVLRYHERFQPDAVWLSADTWVTAQAMGAEVAFPSSNQPLAGTGRPCVESGSDIDRILPPDPTADGRFPLMLEALGYLREALGDDVFLVTCFDQYPFSLACALMGIQPLMMKLYDDPAMVKSLMERCAEYAIAYASALADHGADMLSGGDSPAGLIGPELYRDTALPYEKQVVDALKSRYSLPVSLHICGNPISILADMASTNADILELDQNVAMRDACQAIGPEVTIWGNLDPVALLAQGTPEEVHKATETLIDDMHSCGRRRYVVSSGCTLAMETPAENISAMLEAAHHSSTMP